MDINFFKQTRILDGGMGQELLSRGMEPKGSLWSASALLNENYHDLLLNAHLDYIKAGAEVIVTNTFATRRVRLKENIIDNNKENFYLKHDGIIKGINCELLCSLNEINYPYLNLNEDILWLFDLNLGNE